MEIEKEFIINRDAIKQMHNSFEKNDSFIYTGSAEKYNGYYIEGNPDDGDYDSGKGAMVDWEMILVDVDGNDVAKGVGGYYCQGDYHFNRDITFYRVEDPNKEDIFRNKVIGLSSDTNLTIDELFTKIQKEYETYNNKKNG